MSERALAGRKIVLTRMRDDAAPWAQALAAEGAETVLFPCLDVEPHRDAATRDALAHALGTATWLVVLSARGVECTAALLAGEALPARVRIAAVGTASADASRTLLGRVDFVPTRSTAMDLARQLTARPERLGGTLPHHVVIVGAASLHDDVAAVFADAGARVTDLPVYRTIPAPPLTPRRSLPTDCTDVVFASPSAVTGFVNQAVVPLHARIVSIGPTTTSAARAAGFAVAIEARRPGLAGLLEVL